MPPAANAGTTGTPTRDSQDPSASAGAEAEPHVAGIPNGKADPASPHSEETALELAAR